MGQVCENGMCVPSCPCTACTSSQTCVTTGPQTGQCIASDCATVTCATGQVCQGGTCVDACTGAVCPMGEACTAGNCVAGSGADAGADGGSGLHLDSGVNGEGGVSFDASSGGDSSTGDDGGDADTDFSSKSGCGCHTGGDENSNGWLAAIGIGLAAMVARRRRSARPAR
jgi:MYXO-CTERM domain-containing protein